MLNIPFQLDGNPPYGVSPCAIDLDNIFCSNYCILGYYIIYNIACSFHALGHFFSTGASQSIFVTEAERVQLTLICVNAEVRLTM